MKSWYFDKYYFAVSLFNNGFFNKSASAAHSRYQAQQEMGFLFSFLSLPQPRTGPISQKWVCLPWLDSVGTFTLCDTSCSCFSLSQQWRWSVKSTSVPVTSWLARLSPFVTALDWKLILLICSVNREPSGPLVALELKDPPACRVCLEREEVLAFLDPRETESVWRDDFLTLNTETSGLSYDFFSPPLSTGWHWRKRTRGCPR